MCGFVWVEAKLSSTECNIFIAMRHTFIFHWLTYTTWRFWMFQYSSTPRWNAVPCKNTIIFSVVYKLSFFVNCVQMGNHNMQMCTFFAFLTPYSWIQMSPTNTMHMLCWSAFCADLASEISSHSECGHLGIVRNLFSWEYTAVKHLCEWSEPGVRCMNWYRFLCRSMFQGVFAYDVERRSVISLLSLLKCGTG